MEDLLSLYSMLQTYQLTPNRALGQNFCVDGARLAEIAAAARVADRTVLEVGPGLGALTRALMQAGARRIVAVEKDKRLAEILHVEMDDLRLRVVPEDFLECDIAELTGGEPFVACGNLPYYVTTPIAEKLLCARPESATLMLQKEAAERFFAQPSTRVYGPLCVLASVLYVPERVMDVPRTSYYPVPAVDSVVIRLVERCPRPNVDAELLLMFLKELFSKRRKTIKNNLSGLDDTASICAAAGISPSDRAEALSPETLLRLFNRVYDAAAEVDPPELIRIASPGSTVHLL